MSSVDESQPTRLVPIESRDNDALPFVEVVSRLVTAASIRHNLSVVYTIRIDHWFGPRWLGFCGKICGAAGVRNRTLRSHLTEPPFHPHRVTDKREFHRDDDGRYELVGRLSYLHRFRPSASNIYNEIRWHTLHAWYSGDTVATNKGVLMVYFSTRTSAKAWYVAFDGHANWKSERQIGISRREIVELVETVGAPIAS